MDTIQLTIPKEYSAEFIESANNIPIKDIDIIIDWIKQALRAKISCYISKVYPNKEGKQILECDFPIELPEDQGLSSLDKIWVTKIVQYSQGEIDIFYDHNPDSGIDLDYVDIDILVSIVKNLENN